MTSVIYLFINYTDKNTSLLVVVMRKIPSKSEDVVFPVDTWKSTATHAMDGNDVQIRLPASLFHKHGKYMTRSIRNSKVFGY